MAAPGGVPDEKEEERKRRDKMEREAPIKAMIKAFNLTIKRHNKIDDPVTRTLMKFEKFNMAITCVMSLAEQYAIVEDLSADVRTGLTQVMEQLYEDLDQISEQIEQCNLSPDHRFGRSVMKAGEANFTEHKM